MGAFLVLCTLVCCLLVTITTHAAETITTDPIRCWWKSDKTAVQVGERLNVVLTCSVIDTARASVVPNLSDLDPGAVQLAPFEVLGGTRHEDVKAGMWRYMQFEYTLRLIEDNFFRLDVDIPSLKINYTVQMAQGTNAQQGRELAYVLRPLPIRINSLVPKNTSDIRDASPQTFAAIEARAWRGKLEFTAAFISFAFAAVLLGYAIVRAFSTVRSRVTQVTKGVTTAAIVGGCVKQVDALRSQVASSGWTPESASRLLTVLRIAGAIASSKPITQTEAGKDETAHTGQLVLEHGWLRRKRVFVSSPLTPQALASGATSGRHHPAIEEIRSSMGVLTEICYAREPRLDGPLLDRALGHTADALQKLRRFAFWSRFKTSSAKNTTPLEEMAWSR